MAEGNSYWYQGAIVAALSGAINLTSDTIKITLHTGYTPSQTHEAWADVSATQYGTAGGYTAGGKACATPTVTKAAAIKFDAADPATWTSLLVSPATPSHAIIWDDTHASDLLLVLIVLGTTATNGGNYSIAFASGGIGTITPVAFP